QGGLPHLVSHLWGREEIHPEIKGVMEISKEIEGVLEWPLLYFLSFTLYQHRSMDSLPAVIPCSHYFT
ncbi:unnamed protein product, partial [Bubo scandiacus]